MTIFIPTLVPKVIIVALVQQDVRAVAGITEIIVRRQDGVLLHPVVLQAEGKAVREHRVHLQVYVEVHRHLLPRLLQEVVKLEVVLREVHTEAVAQVAADADKINLNLFFLILRAEEGLFFLCFYLFPFQKFDFHTVF